MSVDPIFSNYLGLIRCLTLIVKASTQQHMQCVLFPLQNWSPRHVHQGACLHWHSFHCQYTLDTETMLLEDQCTDAHASKAGGCHSVPGRMRLGDHIQKELWAVPASTRVGTTLQNKAVFVPLLCALHPNFASRPKVP